MTDQESLGLRNRVTIVLQRSSIGLSLIAGLVVVVIATGAGRLVLGHRVPDIVMVYLLGVVIVAMRFGYIASLITAALSVAALDFFFTPPYLSFAVTDKRYVLTFVIMLLIAFIISNLMERIRRSAEHVRERELRTARLYGMSRELSISRLTDDIVLVACRHLRDLFASDVSVLLPVGGGFRRSGPDLPPEAEPNDSAVATCAREIMAAAPSDPPRAARTAAGDELVGLRASRGVLGVLAIRPPIRNLFATPSNRELLDTFASQIALAIERAQLAEDAQRAQVEVQKERLRNALLSSVSHDLRTPLAVVKGAVTALLDRHTELSESRRQEYLETISDEASRLNRLVRNLLNMTSLEAGALRARKEWQPLEEVVGVALNRLDEQLTGRPVRVDIAPDASIVPFDATLLEQVLINLVENAIRYTPAGSPIEIRAVRVDGGVEVDVADRGPGVAPGQEEHIFEKFRRAAPRTTGGMGLGLTICRGIVSVHGGTIWCENRPDGGASFRFLLPREKDIPAMDGLPEAVADV
ncbi:MAG: DUF4118 domain-containing protein [Polyangiaceae bacterium]|jgi:two-component system sensor histidine kinase KdpD